VIASYKGGTLTCQDMQQGARLFFRGTVFLSDADSVRKYVERIVSRTLLVTRAKSEGLERLPKVKQQIAIKLQDKLAALVYQKEVQDKVSVSDAEVKQYYQRNTRNSPSLPRPMST